jgi:hypothetical protein
MIKTVNKLGIDEMNLNVISTYNKPTVIMFNRKKLKAVLLRLAERQRCAFLILSVVLKVLTRAIKQEKEINVIQIRKEEEKLCVYR